MFQVLSIGECGEGKKNGEKRKYKRTPSKTIRQKPGKKTKTFSKIESSYS